LLSVANERLCTTVLQAVKVNSLGKWKTALQMVSMSTLLVLRQDHAALTGWLPSIMTREYTNSRTPEICRAVAFMVVPAALRVLTHKHYLATSLGTGMQA
jgi:phosphatidylglycerophosphate synthase